MSDPLKGLKFAGPSYSVTEFDHENYHTGVLVPGKIRIEDGVVEQSHNNPRSDSFLGSKGRVQPCTVRFYGTLYSIECDFRSDARFGFDFLLKPNGDPQYVTLYRGLGAGLRAALHWNGMLVPRVRD